MTAIARPVTRSGRARLAATLVVAALVLLGSAPASARAVSERELRIRNRAADFVKKGYDALNRADTAAAVESLSTALAILKTLGSLERAEVEVEAGGSGGGGGVIPEEDPSLQQIAFILEATVAGIGGPGATMPGTAVEGFGPDYQRELAIAEKLRELEEEAEEIRDQQEDVAAAIGDLAEQAAGDEAAGDETPRQQAARAGGEEAAQAGGEEAAGGEAGGEQAGAEQGGQAGGDEAAQAGGEQAGEAGGQAQAEAGGESQGRGTPGASPAGTPAGAAQGEADALAGRQQGVAERAADMADRVSEIGGGDADARDIAEDFLAAAAQARNAAGALRTGELARAEQSAKAAELKLEEAAKGLAGMSGEQAERLVDAVLADLERIDRELGEVRAKTEEVAGRRERGDGGREAAGGGEQGGGGGAPDAATVRDVKALAPRQDDLRKRMEAVERDLGTLRKWAEGDARDETRRALTAAHNIARRGRVSRRMADAVVAFSRFDAAGAASAQGAAGRSVGRMLAKVREAYSSMASDPLSERRAAVMEARQIETKLAGIVGEEAGGAEAGGEAAGAEARRGAEARQGGEAGETGEGREGAEQGEGRESAEAPAEPGQGEAGRAESGEAAQAGGDRPSPRQRMAMGADAARQIGRLVRRVKSRNFKVPGDELSELAEVGRTPAGEFGKVAASSDNEVKRVLKSVRRVKDRLEEEYQSALDAKKLFQAQREECPPRYRPLVNRYFEVLGEATQ